MPETTAGQRETWDFTVTNSRGLHLRFAGEIARHAMRYQDQISISNGSQTADAKSALALLSLAAPVGSRLNLTISGSNAEDALQDLRDFISGYTEK